MASITAIHGSDFSTYDGGQYTTINGTASSSDGTIIYVCISSSTYSIMKSVDSGLTWTVALPSVASSLNYIACSSNGSIVYATAFDVGIYKSTDYGVTFNVVNFLPNNTLPGGLANPEASDPYYAGYSLTNNFYIACDSTGTKLIMTTNAAISVYQSIDGGVSWTFVYTIPDYNTSGNIVPYVASNATGTVLYAFLNSTNPAYQGINISQDSGVTWTSMNMEGITGPFSCLSTNSYGDFVFTVGSSNSLIIFYPTHADTAVLVPSAGNTFRPLANYNDGNNLVIPQNYYETITAGAVVSYALVNKYAPGQPSSVICFKEDSKILCLVDNAEVYVPIQDIRKGVLVKTYSSGYVPVNMIGTSKIYNPADALRSKNRLYKCSTEKYPQLAEDLIITGCHSILVGDITAKERADIKDVMGRIFITENRYRLNAMIDERAEPYQEEGVFSIWHLALDHEDERMNYGVYANGGLLVETTSRRMLSMYSGMTLLE